jgi:hypothetical protein
VLQANRRLTRGLQFQTNYTLSRASDNGQSSVTFTTNNLPFNAFDQPRENGLSNFDRRQKFVTSVVYSPNPFSDGAARHIFNGWTLAPIFNAFSGGRFTGNIANSIAPVSFGLSGSTPGGGANGSGGANRFALVPRNFFKQPNIWYVDMRVSRRFAITERTRLEFLAEGFNLFNRTQVDWCQHDYLQPGGHQSKLQSEFRNYDRRGQHSLPRTSDSVRRPLRVLKRSD